MTYDAEIEINLSMRGLCVACVNVTLAVHHSWGIVCHTWSLLLQRAQQHIWSLRFVNICTNLNVLIKSFSSEWENMLKFELTW